MTDNLAVALYQSIHDDDEVRIYDNWHASSIGECPRAHYYKRLGIKSINKPTAAKMLRWKAGHLIEEVIRPHLKKIYPDIISNQRLTNLELDLTGEYDNYSEKEKMIIEVKSVGPRAPKHRKVNDDRYHLRDESPYLAHEYQNHAYVLLLRAEGKPVEQIQYAYITLEGLIMTYLTPVQEKILTNVQKRLKVLKMALDGQLPDCWCVPEHPLWGSCMQFCDYKDKFGCCSENLIKEEE